MPRFLPHAADGARSARRSSRRLAAPHWRRQWCVHDRRPERPTDIGVSRNSCCHTGMEALRQIFSAGTIPRHRTRPAWYFGHAHLPLAVGHLVDPGHRQLWLAVWAVAHARTHQLAVEGSPFRRPPFPTRSVQVHGPATACHRHGSARSSSTFPGSPVIMQCAVQPVCRILCCQLRSPQLRCNSQTPTWSHHHHLRRPHLAPLRACHAAGRSRGRSG